MSTRKLMGGPVPGGCLFAKTDFLQRQPEVAQALSDGVVQGPAGQSAHWGELEPGFEACARGASQSPIDIRGGIAVNVVPRDCSFEFEMRNLPSMSHDALESEIAGYAERELVPQMRRVAADAGIAFERGIDLPEFGIARPRALALISEVVRVVNGWQRHFKARGVGAADMDALSACIDRPHLLAQRQAYA